MRMLPCTSIIFLKEILCVSVAGVNDNSFEYFSVYTYRDFFT